MSIVFDLLARVEAAGGTAKAEGGNLHLRASEPLPVDLMEALREHKPEVLEVLAVTELTLTQFEQGNRAIEITVSWLDGPIWLAPTKSEAATLMSEGVCRARIWTVRELRDLMSIPGLELEGVRSIQALKDEFGGHLAEVRPVRPRRKKP